MPTTRAFILLFALSLAACDPTTPDTSVAVAAIEISSSAGERAGYIIASGQQETLLFDARDDANNVIGDADVTWSSSDASVVSVGADGTIAAKNVGKATVTVASGSVSDSVELTVYDISGTWQSIPDAGNNFVTMELTQDDDDVTGTFTYSAWTLPTNPEVGHGPITGTLFWDRFVHEADVAQGCVWKLSATMAIFDSGTEIQLKPTVEFPAWVITSTCGGGGTLAISDLMR